jgi:CBS domain-containing protein
MVDGGKAPAERIRFAYRAILAREPEALEADIVAKKGKDVKAIMSKKVISVTEETAVEHVAQLMTTHKIKRLPVMRGDEVVGIVSRADIVSAIALGKHIALHTPVYDL